MSKEIDTINALTRKLSQYQAAKIKVRENIQTALDYLNNRISQELSYNQYSELFDLINSIDEVDVDPNDYRKKVRLVTSPGRVYTDCICPCCKVTLQQYPAVQKNPDVFRYKFCNECGQPLSWDFSDKNVPEIIEYLNE